MNPDLELLSQRGFFSPLDVHFAHTMGELAGAAAREVELAFALTSRQTREGHVCLDLGRYADTPMRDGEGESLADPRWAELDLWAKKTRWPKLDGWLTALSESALVGAPGQARPLVLDARHRLYLRRYYEHEQRLAALLLERAQPSDEPIDRALLLQGLDRLFGSRVERLDLQRIAAVVAITRRLSIITGGPGTGKTSTVARLLALVVEQARSRNMADPRVLLLAPTGKAAARLVEAVKRAKADLSCDPSVKQAIVEEASTIHRALGSVSERRGSGSRSVPRGLLFDVVVVDESSMVDVALMRRLLEALPPKARLVLLGDADQLASVEAGAVLGEICSGGAARRFSRQTVELFHELGERDIEPDRDASPLDDCIVELSKSYRFTGQSAIGLLSAAIKAGDGDGVVSLLSSPDSSSVTLEEPGRAQKLVGSFRQRVIRGFRAYLEAPTAEAALAAFDGYRLLCAHRRGPYGVQSLNPLVEQALSAARLIERSRGRYYRGRPVLVLRNDYHIGLFNGDVGMLWPDAADPSRLKTVFATAGGFHRRLVPARLPEHETVFAMSIHKSQGSEFDEVTIVLPDRESPLCTRELFYTAITRARRGLAVVATPEAVRAAVLRSVERASGLADALRTLAGPRG